METKRVTDNEVCKSLCGFFRDCSISFLISLILLTLCISSAALIFSGHLGDHLLSGIGLILVSAVVTSLILSFTSSFPQAFVSPQDTFVIILAVSGASIAHQLKDMGADDQIFPTIITSAILSSLGVGLILYVIGTFELGNYARFIPYQVLGGFFAGTGLLIMGHSWVVMTGHEFEFAHFNEYFDAHMLKLWAPAIILGTALYVVWRIFWQPLLLPPIVIIAAILFYLTLYVSGLTLSDAMDNGFCLGPFSSDTMWSLPKLSFISKTNWQVLGTELGNLLSMMILAPIALLLNISVVESETKADMHLDNEIKNIGIANFISPALGGGILLNHGMIESVLNYRLGTKSRIAGVVVAVFFVLVIFFSHGFISYLPRFLIGGVVFYVGLDLAAKWLFDTRHSYSFLEYCAIVVIAAVIVIEGFLQGLLLGLIVSLGVFVFNYSKMSVVKQYFRGSFFHSNVERGEKSREMLKKRGNEIHIINLQGFLFFGNSQNLLEKVSSCVEGQKDSKVKHLILDFSSVKGVDSTSIYSFVKLIFFCERNGIDIIFTNIGKELSKTFSKHLPLEEVNDLIRMFPTTDYALEWCENKLLEEEEVKRTGVLSSVFKLRQLVSDESMRDRVIHYFKKMTVDKDFVIIEQGTQATDLFFLESGFVDIVIFGKNNEKIRLRSIGPGTVFGELGLYLNIPRSASIIATETCTLYKMTKENIEKIKNDDPQVAIRFQEMIITQLASRLIYSNEQINGLMQPSCCE